MASNDPQLGTLRDRIAAQGLLKDAQAEDDIVFGTVDFPALEAELVINIDPELEEREWSQVDADVLSGMLTKLVGQTEQDWSDIGDAVIEVLVEDDELDDDDVDLEALRDDLELVAVAVLHEAVLLSFIAQEALPETIIHVQLDDEMDVWGAVLDDGDDEDDEDGAAADPTDWRGTV